MKLRWHHVLILAVTALSTNAGAIDAEENTLRNVLQTIGITTQIQLMEELVVEASRKHTTRCGTSEPSTSIPSFSQESIVFDSVSSFNHSSNLDSLLQWFNSPLADKIHLAEKTPIDSEKFIAAAPQIKQDQQRLQTIKNIIRDTRTVNFIVLLGTEIEYAGLLHSGCIEKQKH